MQMKKQKEKLIDERIERLERLLDSNQVKLIEIIKKVSRSLEGSDNDNGQVLDLSIQVMDLTLLHTSFMAYFSFFPTKSTKTGLVTQVIQELLINNPIYFVQLILAD